MPRKTFLMLAMSTALLVSSASAHEPAAHVAELKTALKLSDDQAKRLLAIFEDSAKKIEPLRAEIEQAQAQLKTDRRDGGDVKVAEDKLNALNRRRQELADERQAAMKSILTREQFATLQKKLASRAKSANSH